MTRRLILLRHGETSYNASGRMQGHLDTELSTRGRAQAAQVAAFLETVKISRIISSDLTRASETARAVGERLGVEVTIDNRLRETNLGQWQARSHAEVDRQFPGLRAYWRHDPTWAPPGGESRLEVARRARPVVDELMREFALWDQGTVLLVAHGGTISALTSHLLELESHQYPLFSGLGNTCWAQLTARPRYSSEISEDDAEDIRPEDLIFTPDNCQNARWYLDGWNMGVSLGYESMGAAGNGEAGLLGGV
ncbi:histidine phosphatase family protein [Corynebacterium sp. ES2794-CONJ1]|uniref:histidine phosphatase family protein n=1 Tax=unclassified Corynebacterium TaxID=2624378 RepID=UPI002169EDFC|nr:MULTISPECIES: histidine phosphatase family protein [unclassified Corynebacterium]MCS4490513.1 histidine phosphatase family protein [Corynebacterium sp. ES2775-CONJ]MCU9519910.1 histidine phosphatase family protein [Corynebacterium sp. ES2794-CONJ1]